jgi:hypothetical protein
MKKYAKEDVMQAVRGLIAKSNQSKVAAGLGYSPQYISQVLKGKKALTAYLALRVGFIQLPDAYVRAPKGKVK